MRILTKVLLGMTAYIFLNELKADLTRSFFKKMLSITFAGIAFTLLTISGIVMVFFDLGSYMNTNGKLGLSFIGISSLIMMALTLLIAGLVFAKPFRKRSQNLEPSSLAEKVMDLLINSWRENKIETAKHRPV